MSDSPDDHMPPERYDRLQSLMARGLTVQEALSLADRSDAEIDRVLQRKSVLAASMKLRGVPSDKWPPFDVRWDCDPARFHLSEDGVEQESFAQHRGAVIVCTAPTQQILDALHMGSTRKKSPWHRDYRDKTAELVEHWRQGGSVTPPLLSPFGNQIHIIGGNHRFYVAVEKRECSMPFLLQESDLAAIQAILPALTLVDPAGAP